MRIHVRAVIACLIGTGVLLGFSNGANAQSLTLAPGGNITANSVGRVTFDGGGLFQVACNMQLRGVLLQNIVKQRGNQFGSIGNAAINNCADGGAVDFVLQQPWRLLYDSIAGVLPNNVTSVLVLLLDFAILLIFIGLVRCLYKVGANGAGFDAPLAGVNPYNLGVLTSQGTPIPLDVFLTPLCPANIRIIGAFGVVPAQVITRL